MAVDGRRSARAVFSALALVPAVFAAGAWAGPDFDQGARVSPLIKEAKARAGRMSSIAPAGGVPRAGGLFGTFEEADVDVLRRAGAPLGRPVARGGGKAVFELSPEGLPALERAVHEKLGRCGGFFGHATRARAESDLAAPKARAAEAVEYTIDQQAWLKPLLARVEESRLRSTIETLAAYNNRYYQADSGADAARWLLGRWEALTQAIPGARGELIAHDWKQPSVVLTIPGTDKKDEIVVLGGHLDSINQYGDQTSRAPGADDNASGIAVLTEALRLLGQSGFRPRRTIEFIGYAGEEEGLLGSQQIAKSYADAGKKVVGVIQFDMTNFKGSDDDVYLLTDNVDGDLTAFLGRLVDAYLGVKWGTLECGYACSDHASWTQNGYPASAAFESTMDGMNRNIHSENDTLANSGGNAEHSVAFAKLAVAFAGELGKAQPGLAASAAK